MLAQTGGSQGATQTFRGVFDSFAAAAAEAPSDKPLGYDNVESAELYLRRLAIDDYDYPSMFWIQKSLQDGRRRIVDLGGSVGIKYFAFRRFVTYPADLRWHVIDVPAVARRGAEFASERGVEALSFSDQTCDIDGSDVLLASGSLQYLASTLGEILATLGQRPGRIVVNTTPVHPTLSFFTLNGIGTAYCPYRIQAHGTFLDAIEGLGYKLRDEWRNLGKAMVIPDHPDHSLDHYTGFCFDAR